MPELPDLEVFSGNLDKELSGKVVKEVKVVNDKKLKVSVDELKNAFEGEKLVKVYREGKELRLKFENDQMLGLHLMLNGELYIVEGANKQRSTVIELLFKDDTALVMTDYQGLATPTLNPEEKDAPDALSKEVDFDFLQGKLAKKTSIKVFLLDQKMIRGIGNAYADEILWDARIHPLSPCNKIPDGKLMELAKSIKEILQEAIAYIRKHHPGLITGEIRDFLKIHNSKKTKSPTGAEIKTMVVNSRKTYYTDEQELYK